MEIERSPVQTEAQRKSDGAQRIIAALTFYVIALFLQLTILIGFDYGFKLSLILYPFAIFFLIEGVRYSLSGGDLLKS